MVSLGFRHTLPVLVGIAWLAATFLLLPRGLGEFEWLTWLAALFFAMYVVDCLYVAYARRRYGVDPLSLHWSQRRNRNGDFFCGHCGSIFMLPPEGMSDAGLVYCGDCGAPVALWGEMKPLARAHGRRSLERMARHLWR